MKPRSIRSSSLTGWAYTREAGSHTLAPGVPVTTGRTGMSPGRALVPYRRAGTPAIHDAGTAGGSVTAGPASVRRVRRDNNWNDGEKSCDQKGSHILPRSRAALETSARSLKFLRARRTGRGREINLGEPARRAAIIIATKAVRRSPPRASRTATIQTDGFPSPRALGKPATGARSSAAG
jgi:hypothetical protein